MKVAIRTDASYDIGTGHVMRCLTLAASLRDRGAEILFVCRQDEGDLCAHIEHSGFAVERLAICTPQEDAQHTLAALERHRFLPDLLVVDHYGLDRRWEGLLRPVAKRILVIDDLGDRAHDCDVLLDPNLHDSPASRYAGLIPAHARAFVGPEYALLRPEFDRVEPRMRDRGVGRILAFFGGADPSNEALKVVQALRALAPNAPKTLLILGPINAREAQIRGAAEKLECLELIKATDAMARLMSESDLALGTCGGAAWERCVLGLPALVVVSADNQRDDARLLGALGAVRNLGEASGTGPGDWRTAITALREDPAALSAMSSAALRVMHGRREARAAFEHALVH